MAHCTYTYTLVYASRCLLSYQHFAFVDLWPSVLHIRSSHYADLLFCVRVTFTVDLLGFLIYLFTYIFLACNLTLMTFSVLYMLPFVILFFFFLPFICFTLVGFLYLLTMRCCCSFVCMYTFVDYAMLFFCVYIFVDYALMFFCVHIYIFVDYVMLFFCVYIFVDYAMVFFCFIYLFTMLNVLMCIIYLLTVRYFFFNGMLSNIALYNMLTAVLFFFCIFCRYMYIYLLSLLCCSFVCIYLLTTPCCSLPYKYIFFTIQRCSFICIYLLTVLCCFSFLCIHLSLCHGCCFCM